MADQQSPAVLRWYGLWERAFEAGMPKKFRRILANWLAQQRWFITKEEHAPGIEIAHAWQVQIDERFIWWLLLHLKDETRSRRLYQLPLVMLNELRAPAKAIALIPGPRTSWLVDAWSWPPFAKHIMDCLAQIKGEAELQPGLKLWSDEPLNANLAAIPVETDQSNTIIRFDERYFFKVFRSLTPGVQPDEEVGRYLHHRRFDYTIPPIAGCHWQLAVSAYGRESKTTLALCSPFIANQGSAWSWLVEQLTTVAQTFPLTRPSPPGGEGGIPKKLAQAIEHLGQRTAQLHLALAHPTDDPAFKPISFTLAMVNQLQQRILEKAHHALAILRESGPALARRFSGIRELLNPIFQVENQLLEKIVSWQPTAIDGVATRIHGDYHLGQVLRTKDNDWLIIDFEGEPLRPTAERRIKDSPLRDVAGMLRSFAYAQSVAESEVSAASARLSSTQDDTYQSAWQQVIAQFLQRYFSTLQGQGVIPSDPESLQRLLELYELEKTLYEIEYELKSRPKWLWIPLIGLKKLSSKGQKA